MNYRYILSLDPSGAFYEGKGTTGWYLYDCLLNRGIDTGLIQATEANSMEEYWDKHCDLIRYYQKLYSEEFVVVMEDYILYANKAEEQTNSRMETPKLIGTLQHFCWTIKQPYYMQLAVEAKTRWTDEILCYKGLLVPYKRGHCIPLEVPIKINKHSKDAVRHALHYATFKNKEKAYV